MINKILYLAVIFVLNMSAVFGIEPPLRLTKTDVLRTWVHPSILAQPDMVEEIQELEKQEITDNRIPDGPFTPSPTEIELAFLQHVRELSETKGQPVTLQISTSLSGFVFQGVPFVSAAKGTHHVSFVDGGFDGLCDEGSLKYVEGDCFETLNHLAGKVDAIYVDRFENSLNPIQHQKFLRLVQRLLKPGRKAFFVSHSFASNDLYEWTRKQMETTDDLYPGFAEHTTSAFRITSGDKRCSPPATTASIRRPLDGEKTSVEFRREEKPGDQTKVSVITTEFLENMFSPEIYRRVFGKQISLTLSDTFYIGTNGKRADGPWDADKMFAAAIVQKTAAPPAGQIARPTLMGRLYAHRNLVLCATAVGMVAAWQLYVKMADGQEGSNTHTSLSAFTSSVR